MKIKTIILQSINFIRSCNVGKSERLWRKRYGGSKIFV